MSDRAKKLVRARIKSSGKYSVRIHFSNKYLYAQIVDPKGLVLTTVSSKSKEILGLNLNSSSNKSAASAVGALLGKKIVSMSLKDKIAYDRSGRLYHGRVAAIAEAARQEGVEF